MKIRQKMKEAETGAGKKWNGRRGRVFIFLLMMLLMVNSTMDSTLYSHYIVKQTLNMGVMVFFLMMLVKRAYRMVLGHFR